MARVRCRVASVAPGKINGYEFDGAPGAMLSEEMPDEAAAALAEVPGYEIEGAERPADVRDMGLVEAASAFHAMPWIDAVALPPALPGDANNDGRLSAAEKRAAAKKAAAAADAAQA